MSIQAISLALAVQGVEPLEKLLLIALANYASPRMTCWPSQGTLARDTCMSDRTIRRLVIVLGEKGLIERKPQFRPNGSRTSDLITLRLTPPDTQSGHPRTEMDKPPDTQSAPEPILTVKRKARDRASDENARTPAPTGSALADFQSYLARRKR